MKKKKFALIACLVMTASLLADCGGTNDDKEGGDIDTSDPITVTIFQQADDMTMEDVENNPVTLYWEKMFNIDKDTTPTIHAYKQHISSYNHNSMEQRS